MRYTIYTELAKRVNGMRYLQAIIIILMSTALCFAAPVGYTQDVNNPPLPKPVGRVVWVKGVLKAIMPNQEERLLKKTSLIYEKDTLTTDAESQAQVVFSDNTLMTFREGTKFVISQYSYRPASGKKSVGKYIMNLIEGGFRTITGIIAKTNPEDYQVNTPVATIGVRGTDYAVVVLGGELYVGYYSGEPCVTSAGTEGEGAKTLCLNPENEYGYVPRYGATPVPVSQRPEVFREKLEIVPARITPFSASEPASSYTPRGAGPVSSFCITQ